MIFSRVIRIFLSSTFGDLKAERNVLQNQVFPEFRKACEAEGYQFQVIDLRWGISEEASLNQQTMRICLDEVRRCQEISCFPNFMILLGDRYGWNPLPYQIPQSSFEKILRYVEEKTGKENGFELSAPAFLREWYLLDENELVPTECGEKLESIYYLKPRQGDYVSRRKWGEVEARLLIILRAASKEVLSRSALVQFFLSATAQEIVLGAINIPPEAREDIYCFSRKITNIEELYKNIGMTPFSAGKIRAEDFVDTSGGSVDRYAFQQQAKLREKLKTLLPRSFLHYESEWTGSAITIRHLDQLCLDVKTVLHTLLKRRMKADEARRKSEREILLHASFAEDWRKNITGFESLFSGIIKAAKKTLFDRGKGGHFLVTGDGGSGKTSFMAGLLSCFRAEIPESTRFSWFVGVTPRSFSLREILTNLLEVLKNPTDNENSSSQSNWAGEIPVLLREYAGILEAASREKKIVILVDGLDQINPGESFYVPAFLEAPLPPNVILVFSLIENGKLYNRLSGHVAGLQVFRLSPLSRLDATTALTGRLADAGRRLQPAQATALLDALSSNGRPLYLKLLFERSRKWRSHEIQLIQEKTTEDLIGKLFDDLSRKEEHGPLLVERISGALTCSRFGLSEEEILETLAWDDEFWLAFILGAYHDIPASFSHADFINIEVLTGKILTGDDPISRRLHKYIPESPGISPDEVIAGLNLALQTETFPIREWISQIRVSRSIFAKLESVKGDNRLPIFNRWILERAWPEEIRKPARKIPTVIWTRLASDLQPYLGRQGFDGAILFTFFHRQFPETIVRKYLAGDSGRRIHSVLAEYFFQQPDRASGASNVRHLNRRKLVEAVYQAIRGDRFDIVQNLIFSYNFLTAKIEAGMIFDLLEDLQEAYKGSSVFIARRHLLKLIVQALKFNASFLMRHPSGFFQALWNQFRGCDDPAAAVHFEGTGPEGEAESPANQYEGVSALLSEWEKTRKNGGQPDPWLRALRPPATRPGSAQLASFSGGSEAFACVTFSGDGVRAAAGTSEGSVFIWDAMSGKELVTWKLPSGGIRSLDFSPREDILAGCCGDNSIRLWQAGTGSELVKLECWNPSHLRFSPDGSWFVTGSGEKGSPFRNPTLRIWEGRTGRELFTSPEHPDRITDAVVSFDGSLLASSSADGTIRISDSGDGNELHRLEMEEIFPVCLAFTLDGQGIFWAANDRTIRFWHFGTSGESVVFAALPEDHPGTTSLALSPDGEVLASGSGGGRVAAKENSIMLWNTSSCAEINRLTGHRHRVSGLRFLNDGRRLISSSADRTVRLWDFTEKDDGLRLTDHEREITCVGISESSPLIASGSFDNSIRLWHAPTGKCLQRFSGHEWGIQQVIFSPDGGTILSYGGDGMIRIWSVAGGPARGEIHLENRVSAPIVFSRDSAYFAASSGPLTINIWESSDGSEVVTLSGKPTNCTRLHFSLSCDEIIAGGDDGSIVIWDYSKRKIRSEIKAHSQGISTMTLSPDGLTLLTGSLDRLIKLWSVAAGNLLTVLEGHTNAVRDAVFNFDMKRIYSESDDWQACEWDTETGKMLQTWKGHGGIRAAASGSRYRLMALPANELVLVDETGLARAWYPGSRMFSAPDGSYWVIPESNHLQILVCEPG